MIAEIFCACMVVYKTTLQTKTSFSSSRVRNIKLRVLMKYKELLQSDSWKVYKNAAKELFLNRCWFCGNTKNLDLHHTRYYKTNTSRLDKVKKKPRNNIRWLLLICRQCHQEIHRIQKQENLEIYLATKTFRDRYFPKKHMWLTKRQIAFDNKHITRN